MMTLTSLRREALTVALLAFVVLPGVVNGFCQGPSVFFLNPQAENIGFYISQLSWSTGQTTPVYNYTGDVRADQFFPVFYGGDNAGAVHGIFNFSPLKGSSSWFPPYSTLYTTNLTTFDTHIVNLTELAPNSTVKLATWDPYSEQMFLLTETLSTDSTTVAIYSFDPVSGGTKFFGSSTLPSTNSIEIVALTSDGAGRLYAVVIITDSTDQVSNSMLVVEQSTGVASMLTTNYTETITWATYNPQRSAVNNMITFSAIAGTPPSSSIVEITFDTDEETLTSRIVGLILPLAGCSPTLQYNVLSTDGLSIYALGCYFNYLYQISVETAKVITTTSIVPGYVWGIVIN
eukprot:TRINITY_DN248_c0_g1_i1.p1 TRINITY_DN248_c0_g1~~TRINITY_DN248_c0_g1_i1.p1  ORF type:complete len:364 (-),score=57.98 TRINITY_DN248_c0_g1_i1:46-1083(-)